MKNWKLYITLFVVAYLGFMIANLPAAMVLSNITLSPTIKMGDVSGTVWNGNVTAVQVKQDVITDVHWELSPLSLLMGRLSADVKFGRSRDKTSISGNGDIATNFAMDQVSAEDFTLRYPAKALMQRLNMALPVEIDGSIEVKLAEFEQGKPYCEALQGAVLWSKASIEGMNGNIKLGQLDGELACQNGEVELKITKKNPLGLQITSLLGANNKFSVKGFVKPNGDMPTEVHNAMRFLGQADSKGRFPVSF
jgi:general secretion pathway protein N